MLHLMRSCSSNTRCKIRSISSGKSSSRWTESRKRRILSMGKERRNLTPAKQKRLVGQFKLKKKHLYTFLKRGQMTSNVYLSYCLSLMLFFIHVREEMNKSLQTQRRRERALRVGYLIYILCSLTVPSCG